MKESKTTQILALDLLRQLKESKPISSISSCWDSFNTQEKENLASQVLEEAKKLIIGGQDFAFNAFDLVRRIAPQSATMHFKLGVFLFDYGVHKSNEKYLQLALKYVEQALKLENQGIDAWAICGDILVHLGLMNSDSCHFHSADEKYQKAYDLSQNNPKYLKKFMWDWALCSYYLGKHSGEAVDIKRSIDLFDQAAKIDLDRENFWRDFGNAYVAMGLLISDERFLQKALGCYQKALQIKPTYYKGWLSTANTFHKLYQLTNKEDFLSQAHTAYSKAADLERENLELWVNWGQLFLQSGVAKEDVKHLQMAIMKFDKSLEMDSKSFVALAGLSEAYATLGNINANLEHLKLSEQKIEEAQSLQNNSSSIFYCKGYCYHMHGQYFDDSSYYLMAIENYKRALEIEPNHFHSLFGLGITELALGNLHQDEEHYLSAHKYFRKASNGGENFADLWNQWGMVHLRLAQLLDESENIRQAVEKFERSLSFYKGLKPPALLLFNYGCALDFLGNYTDDPSDYQKSAEILELLIKNYSGYECVHYNLALVYQHLAEMDSDVDYYCRALENFHLAAQDDPEDGLIWLRWATTLMQYAQLINEDLKQDFYEALLEDSEKKLRQAMALGEEESYFQMGCLHSMKKNPMEALHFLQMAQSKNSLPDVEELMYEPALEALRSYEPFHDFVQSSPVKERFDDN
ncbi:MAG: Photosystem I assembly protein Ycf3 [Chlamydiae bacterium]|nr:Photosystem I assembly protein Ycf3 [Chlamydiota bacterium]